MFEQIINALEVHAAVSHVLYGTEGRKEGRGDGGLVSVCKGMVVLEHAASDREDCE